MESRGTAGSPVEPACGSATSTTREVAWTQRLAVQERSGRRQRTALQAARQTACRTVPRPSGATSAG